MKYRIHTPTGILMLSNLALAVRTAAEHDVDLVVNRAVRGQRSVADA